MSHTPTTTAPEPTRAQRRFESRVAACASGGKFCDGWILAVIGVALPMATTGLDIDPVGEGLIASASLIGLFIGGLTLGWVTDRVGRKMMFLITLLTFLICSGLQMVVGEPWQLFVLRVLMGMAIGADYAIAGAMIAEFTSKARRGPGLAGMMIWWYAGFSISASLAILAIGAWGDDPNLWRWILGSSAVPALVMLFVRIGLPESPRWLVGQGRLDEARVIADRYLAPETRDDVFKEPASSSGGYASLFNRENIRKTALTSIFWMAQITPFFAIYVFLPKLLEALDLTAQGQWAEIVLYLFLLVGCIVGALVINRLGRRRLLIWGFVLMGLPLLVLGLWPTAPAPVIIACFIVFAFFHAASSVLQMLYPSEIFPTEIRATGIGFAAGMSRIGAAAGTFLLPIGIVAWGVGPVMLVGVAVCLLGLVVSIMWAPETSGLELTAATATVKVQRPAASA